MDIVRPKWIVINQIFIFHDAKALLFCVVSVILIFYNKLLKNWKIWKKKIII